MNYYFKGMINNKSTTILSALCLFILFAVGCTGNNSTDYVEFQKAQSLEKEASQSTAGERPQRVKQLIARSPVVAQKPTLPLEVPQVSPKPDVTNHSIIPVVALKPGISDTLASSLPSQTSLPREIKLLIRDRQFRIEGPGNALRVSYDDFDLLKVLNMEPVVANAIDHFPDWLLNLNGKQVRVRGFMYPPFQEQA